MKLAIAGVGTAPVTRDDEAPLLDQIASTARAALADAGIEASEVDGIFCTEPRMSGDRWMMFAATLGAFLGFRTRALAEVNNGGASSLVALRAACDAVALGRCGAVLVIASDGRPELDIHHLQSFVRRACIRTMGLYGPIHGLFGFGAPVPFYAMGHQRYMYEHGVTEEQIAGVSVALRRHATEHPLAQFRKPITVDDVLSSPLVSPPIHLLQAAGISTGVCVAVVTSAERARSTGRPVVELAGYGEDHHPSHFVPRHPPITRFPAVERAAGQALEEAGVTAQDLDVAEVYGVFGATELMLYEELGFCDHGQAAHLVARGGTTLGGDLLVNPTGGRLSFGHPAGATPLYSIAEVVRQLRGEAPGLQAPGAELGLVQAEHGMCNGAVVTVLRRAA